MKSFADPVFYTKGVNEVPFIIKLSEKFVARAVISPWQPPSDNQVVWLNNLMKYKQNKGVEL